MATEASRPAGDGPDTMNLLCSHGGRHLPRAHDGAIRYAGGETRVLVVPRGVSFRELTRRLQDLAAGGAEVVAVRHRLADEVGLEDDDVLVSVTCDEELEHMRAEYDRLLATRPAARFRVFVTTAPPAASVVGSGGGAVRRGGRSSAAGLPPLPPKMKRRVQSDQAQVHRRAACPAAPVRRVQCAQEFTGRLHAHQSLHHHQHQQCFFSCQRRDLCAAGQPLKSPMYAVPCMFKKVAAH